MKVKAKISKALDVFILIGSILILLFACFMALGSIKVSAQLITNAVGTDAKLFYGTLLLALVFAITNLIERFVNTFAVAYKNIFQKQNGL